MLNSLQALTNEIFTKLWPRIYWNLQFTNEETGSEQLSQIAKITHLVNVEARAKF